MRKEQAITALLASMREVAPSQHYTVDRFRPEDGPGVARLFYAVYGERYPVADFYMPLRIAALNEAGSVFTVVARAASGDILGQAALYRSSSPNPHVYEFGQMLVLPAYRDTFVGFKVYTFLVELLFSLDVVHVVFGEAVCNHTATQKLSKKIGSPACGLELALMPDDAYVGEGAGGRVSCLFMARAMRDVRRPLYLPARWEDFGRLVVEDLALDREVVYTDVGAEGGAPLAEATDMAVEHFAEASVQRLTVARVGRDFEARAEAADKAMAEAGFVVSQCFLNAADPAAPRAVEILRRQGYFLGGIAPLWFGTEEGEDGEAGGAGSGDALFVQKVLVDVDPAALKLFSDTARVLAGYIFADRDEVRREAAGNTHGRI